MLTTLVARKIRLLNGHCWCESIRHRPLQFNSARGSPGQAHSMSVVRIGRMLGTIAGPSIDVELVSRWPSRLVADQPVQYS